MNPLEIPGWMLPIELNWLTNTAKSKSSIIEVGTWKGRSTSALCNGTKGKVISIDNYSGSVIDKENFTELAEGKDIELVARNNLREYLNSGKLTMYREPFMIPESTRADMIFIDGDHEYAHALFDILFYMKFMVNKESIISGHDIHLGCVRAAVEEVFGKKWRVATDTIWVKEF